MKNNASKLTTLLKDEGIRWDENGKMIYEGEFINGKRKEN